MQKKIKFGILVVGLFLLSSIPLPGIAASSDITITSPTSGSDHQSSSSITFSWTSPRSGSSWRMYYKIDSAIFWTSGSLPSGSFSQTLSSGSHTFSIKIEYNQKNCYFFWGQLRCINNWVQKDLESVSFSVYSGDITITNPSSNWKYLDFSSDRHTFTTNVDSLSNYFKVYTRQSSTTTYTYIKTVSTDNAGGNFNFDLAYWNLRGGLYSPDHTQYLKVVNYDDNDAIIDTYYRYFYVQWKSADSIRIDLEEAYSSNNEWGDQEFYFKMKIDGGSWATSGTWKGIGDHKWFDVGWYREYDDYDLDEKIYIEMWEDDSFWDNKQHSGSFWITYDTFRVEDWTSTIYVLDDDETWTHMEFDKSNQEDSHRMKIKITLTGIKCR